MRRDVLAGVLLVNAIPHAVVGFAGHRCLTPIGGEDSSPGTNLLWSAINVTGGAGLLASSSWRGIGRVSADRRRMSLQAGTFAMTTFGAVYELTAGRRKRTAAARNAPAAGGE